MDLHHVYICGHSECEKLDDEDPNSAAYIFVLPGCSDPECANTDTAWFAEQYDKPGPDGHSTLAKLTDELQDIRIIVKANLDTYASLPSKSVNDTVYFSNRVIAPLLIDAYEREHFIEKLFHFTLITTLLKHMHYAAKNASHRPFFDYCCREVQSYIEEAKTNAEKLNSSINRLKDRDAQYRRWRPLPYNTLDRDEDFGTSELELLRAAGDIGLEILQKPVDMNALHEAHVLVACMKQNISTKARPSCSSPVDDFDAWLQQEESAYNADIAKALKNKRVVYGRPPVKRLGKVPPKINTFRLRGPSRIAQLV